MAVCMIGLAGALGILSCRRLYVKRENLLSAYEKELVSGIVCYGDSLTAGTGGEGVSYPLVLEENLKRDRIYIPVFNMGIGGETSITIAGRAGGIPFCTASFTIPEETEKAEVHFIEEEGRKLNLLSQDGGVDTGINPCMIGGVEGCLSSEWHGDELVYYFTRSERGEEMQIADGTAVKTWAEEQFRDYIYVVFIGQNMGFTDIQDLVRQQRAIIGLQRKQAEKYIVVGLTSGTKTEREELERAMQEEYGEKYINLREYLSSQGLDAAGIEPTKEDLVQMERGEVPSSLLTDQVHFNAEGYRLIGNLIYDRMEELGYFEELQKAVEEYG